MEEYVMNADRFSGFAALYDEARPALPLYAVEIMTRYRGGTPDLVVDLGCGTGLSTAAWKTHCGRALGIEPSDDMLRVAFAKADDTVSFRKAFAHETGLPTGSADVVVCSQSFHWMEPERTLAEVNRLLKPEGIFATVDCDWPPVCDWQAEQAYAALFEKVHAIEFSHPDIRNTFVRWDKDRHLSNIRGCGYFQYTREIVFANRELCDAHRFIALAMSQGGLQTILKKQPALIAKEAEAFIRAIHNRFGDKRFPLDFCYRMRLGIK